MRPVVLLILDGVGWGKRDDTDAVFMADTPHFDALLAGHPWCRLAAHGTAVGLPSNADMGNSEVGHNAMGAGRVIDQGAKLIESALQTGEIWQSEAWRKLASCPTVHFIGLVSDGNVHSHVNHLRTLVAKANEAGVARVRVHALTDGRDVSARSALNWITPLEQEFGRYVDTCIASGGGRMAITMDRYDADWAMVERGWNCHVHGRGRAFASATEAITTMYKENEAVDDQWLAPFVVHDEKGPVGPIRDGDGVCFFNFRGDRAIELTVAFEAGAEFTRFDRGVVPRVVFAGMMQYDGDLRLPSNFLVAPPRIDNTVSEAIAAAGKRTYAISETQKFGHVTYFWNGNRSGKVDAALETYAEVPSDRVPFDQAPRMKAMEISTLAADAIRSGKYDHIRINLANGDMVGHTGNFAATVTAMEWLDTCIQCITDACGETGAILLLTADHGNADEMFELDKKGKPILLEGKRKPRTSHSLNPVPFVLIDPKREWELADVPNAGIASIGGTLLRLFDIAVPAEYAAPLVRRK